MSVPKVSVIMAAYNVERYIDEAIQSVLAQRGVSFELLIGDDASADGTWNRIRSYLRDPRLRAWRFTIHRGAASIRNRLIARARGRYLSICDADDAMLPENLRRLTPMLERESAVGVVFGEWLRRIDERSCFLPGRIHFRGPSRDWDLIEDVVPHAGTMHRKGLVRRIGGYRSQFALAEDYDLYLRLAEMTHFKSFSGCDTYLWRKRKGSLTHSAAPLHKLFLTRTIQADAIRRRYGVVWEPELLSSLSKIRSYKA